MTDQQEKLALAAAITELRRQSTESRGALIFDLADNPEALHIDGILNLRLLTEAILTAVGIDTGARTALGVDVVPERTITSVSYVGLHETRVVPAGDPWPTSPFRLSEWPPPLADGPRRIFVNVVSDRFGPPADPAVVYVGPGSRWANPVTFSDVGGQYPSLNDQQLAVMVRRQFEDIQRAGTVTLPNWRHLGGRRGPITFTYPPLEEIRAELAGKHLSCNCPPDEACHADILLTLANPTTQEPTP